MEDKNPLANLAKALLEAGNVRRFHTLPLHQPYTVARHSWGMAALLFELHPCPNRNLIWAVLFHDVAERWLGDTPAPAKWWIAPAVGDALHTAEHQLLKELGLEFPLMEEEREWLKALDILELFLFCLSEEEMGNRNVSQTTKVCYEFLQLSWIPKEVRDYLDQHEWAGRSDDCFGRRP